MFRTCKSAALAAAVVLVAAAAAACAPMPAGAAISGRVLDWQTGLPLAGVTVTLGDTGGSAIAGRSATTGADGRFSIGGVTVEESSLLIGGKAGYEEGFVGCPLGFNLRVVPTFGDACTFATTDLGDIDLDPLGAFTGRVLDSSTRLPVEGAYVTPTDTSPSPYSDLTVQTGPDGRFTIPSLTGEEYGVQVEKSNGGYETGYVTCPDPTTGEHQVEPWGGACTFSPMDLGVVLLDATP